MKAAYFEKPGLENLKVGDLPKPAVGPHDVLVKVTLAGVNPIDYFVISGLRGVPKTPHIPGAEFAGVVEEIGDHVKNVKPGDRVAVYPRIYDGRCDLCVRGFEMLCRNGGIVGLVSYGGFAEYVVVPSKNVFKIPDSVSDEVAASLPVGGLTAYHSLKVAEARFNEVLVSVGASGNTGMFVVQLAKMMGLRVVAISRKSWVRDFGADLVTTLDRAYGDVENFTGGRMADIVIDPLGSKTFESSIKLLGANGRFVTFGVLTGAEVKLSLAPIYHGQISIRGSTGGTVGEFMELVELASRYGFKVRVWRTYSLDQAVNAVKALFDSQRDGRIFIKL